MGGLKKTTNMSTTKCLTQQIFAHPSPSSPTSLLSKPTSPYHPTHSSTHPNPLSLQLETSHHRMNRWVCRSMGVMWQQTLWQQTARASGAAVKGPSTPRSKLATPGTWWVRGRQISFHLAHTTLDQKFARGKKKNK